MAMESPSARGRMRKQQLWGHKHLPLLVGASSKDSVEYILQALWRTRNTGLDSADRSTFRDILHLPSDSDLDPLLACLRMLIRSCVYGNTPKEEIQKLFPPDVSPELQKLLTLLLQKFQSEWKDDVLKDQLKAGTKYWEKLGAVLWIQKEIKCQIMKKPASLHKEH